MERKSVDGNWKDCFSARILDRGYEYYLNDCIQDIERTKDGFMAVVDGSREYTVTIDIDDDGNFLDADCDCPYSQDGNYCKHEAAVLYSLELDEDDWTGEDCDVEDDESLEEIVRQMSRDELESVVLDIASYDRKIRNRILLAYSDSSSSAFLGTLKEEVRKLCTTIREAEDEWYDEFNEKVESAADELSDVLESSIRTMLDKGRSSDAFESAMHAWDSIPFRIVEEQAMENRKRLVQTLVSLLAESYEAGEATQQRVMKRRLSERFNELPKDDIRFYPLCRMMLSHLMDKELALSIIDERKERNDDSSIELCILSYRALGRLNDMWTSICSHLDIKAAVDIGADELAYQGDVGSLVTFLYKVRNTDFSGARSYASQDILSSISTRLLNIFSSCSMEDEYTGELEYNILHFFQPDLEKIHLFRKRVNEGRWKEVYAKLKKSALLCYRMPVLMLEENDMDTLMDWGEQNAKYQPSEYERKLYEIYPKRVIHLALRRAEDASSRMGKRSHYSDLADALSYLYSYEKGRNEAMKLLQEVKGRYPGRPALVDEIGKRDFLW